MTPEGKIKQKVKDWLNEIGAYWFMPVPSGYGQKTLDFLVCYKGRFIAIETKRPGGQMTKFQLNTAHQIAESGGRSLLISCERDLEIARDMLRAYENSREFGDAVKLACDERLTEQKHEIRRLQAKLTGEPSEAEIEAAMVALDTCIEYPASWRNHVKSALIAARKVGG